MPKQRLPDPSPSPPSAAATADAFTTPPAVDAFSPPSEEEQKRLWAELAELLRFVSTQPSTIEHRRKANDMLTRLGLAPELGPLLRIAVAEAMELQEVIALGAGQSEIARAAQEELRTLSNLAGPPSIEAARAVAAERQRLLDAHSDASRKMDAAKRALSGLTHLHRLFPEVFGLPPIWGKEDFDWEGRPKTRRGILSTTVCPPKTATAMGDMKLSPYSATAWREFCRPEPTPPKRRFRSLASSTANSAFPRQ